MSVHVGFDWSYCGSTLLLQTLGMNVIATTKVVNSPDQVSRQYMTTMQ